MAAVLSSDMDNTDKVVMFVNECKNLDLKIISPHINHSQYKFTVNEQGEIVYGLGAIKGVGHAAIDNILAAREKDGAFKDMFEFCQRIDTRKANKRVLEALVCSGALDNLGLNRATMFASIETALKAAEQHARRQQNGQFDLFADIITPITQTKIYKNMADWNDNKRLAAEHDTLGLYLTGHPIEQYEIELSKFTTPIAKLNPNSNQSIIIAGFISTIKTLLTKSGNRMAVINLADRSANVDVTIFNELYTEYRDQLIKGTLLIIEGEVSIDNFSGGFRVQAKRILDITAAREEYAKYLLLNIDKNQADKEITSKLTSILKPFIGGKCMVCINYARTEAKSKLLLGDKWKIKPTDELLAQLNALLGENKAIFQYV
jgi:DNA polymerase-3 subunit alpha